MEVHIQNTGIQVCSFTSARACVRACVRARARVCVYVRWKFGISLKLILDLSSFVVSYEFMEH